MAAGGTRSALFGDVGVFALATVMASSARGLPEAVPRPDRSNHRLREALVRVRAEPLLRRLVGVQAMGMLFFTITIPVDVIFAQHTLDAGAGGYGVLLGAWGGGTIVGSALYARWRSLSSRFLITVGTVVIGGGFLVMALAPNIGIAVAGSAVAGVGTGTQGAAMRSAVQEATPVEWMALILSLNELVFQAVPGAGILLGGAITAVAGARTGLAVAAAGSLFVALLVWLRLAATDGPAALAAVKAPDSPPGFRAPARQR